jgi:hypothetical protein
MRKLQLFLGLLARIDHLVKRLGQNAEITGYFRLSAQPRATARDGARHYNKVRDRLRNAAHGENDRRGTARDRRNRGDREEHFGPEQFRFERGNRGAFSMPHQTSRNAPSFEGN